MTNEQTDKFLKKSGMLQKEINHARVMIGEFEGEKMKGRVESKKKTVNDRIEEYKKLFEQCKSELKDMEV